MNSMFDRLGGYLKDYIKVLTLFVDSIIPVSIFNDNSLKDDVGGYTLKQVLLLWGFAASTYGLSHFIFKEVICS